MKENLKSNRQLADVYSQRENSGISVRIKRVADLVIAFGAITFLSPLILFTALGVFLLMGRPIVFSQIRIGKARKPFMIYKFRTMRNLCGPDGAPLPDGARLTKFGAWLRKMSLDELPQLWNVLKGDISLVGPRPMPLSYGPYFKPSEELRFSTLPGITGWAQIHGRNEASWDERFARDVWYVQNWSLGLDFKILFLTLIAVFARRGVVVDARSIMLNLDEERDYLTRTDS